MVNLTAAKRLFELWAEVRDLSATEELLTWDQETYMPTAGHEARGQALATLAGIKHQRLTATELDDCLRACAEHAEATDDDILNAQVREAHRITKRAARVPVELAKAQAEARVASVTAWHQAREEDRFEVLEPELTRLVGLARDEAAAVDSEAPPYDTLLELYEPGATSESLSQLFAELCSELAPMVGEVVDSGPLDDSAVRGHYPLAAQRTLARWLAGRVGFDLQRGRIDGSEHPFCTALSRNDVRLTWRGREDDFRPGFFGLLHELGHALYEQGLPGAWERTPLGQAPSLGLHESQSRLWENHVGRSLSFWRGLLPHFRRAFPAQSRLSLEGLWPALHVIRPTAIRVDADETTYSLHIVARFELEKALLDDELAVAELPEAWNEAYQRLLGVRGLGLREGVLQDIHWPSGLFGYFPTYTLGSLLAAQLFSAAQAQIAELDEALVAGDFSPLLGWLQREVHSLGSRHSPSELVVRATGGPLTPRPFLDHVRQASATLHT